MDTSNPYDDTIHGWPREQQRETVSRPGYYRSDTYQQPAAVAAQSRPNNQKQEQRMPKYQARMLAGKLKNSSLILALGAFGLIGVLIGTHMPATAQITTSSDTNSPNNTSSGTPSTSPWDNQSGNNPWSSPNQGGQDMQGNNGGFFQSGGNYGFDNGGSTQAPSTRSRTS